MRKNKKIIAILTLVLFAMSMLPVAAFAATDAGTVTAITVTPENVLEDTAQDLTVTLTVDATDFIGTTGEVLYVDLVNTFDAATAVEADLQPNGTYVAILPTDATDNAAAGAKPVYAFVGAPDAEELQGKIGTYNVVAQHTVTYDANGGVWPAGTTTPVTAETDIDGNATAPAQPTRNGFVFDGWSNEGPYTADTTVTAVWVQAEAEPGVPVSDASIIEVIDKTVDVNEFSTTDVSLRDAFGRRADVAEEGEYIIYVWAEERVGQPTSALTEVKNGNTFGTAVGNNVYRIRVDNNDSLELKYSRAGEYSVYASLADPNVQVVVGDPNYGENAAYGNVAVFKSTSRVVTVEGDKADVVAIGVDSVNSPDNDEVVLFDGGVYGEESNNAYVWNGTQLVLFDENDIDPIYVDPNGVSESNIDFVVYQYQDDNNNGIIDEEEEDLDNLEPVDIGIDVTFDTNSNAIKVSKDKDTTDYNGEVDIAVTGTVEGTYKIYVKAGGVEITVPVQVTPLRADSIRITDEPTGPIASGSYDTCGEFGFQILDPNGMVLNRPLDTDSAILGVDGLRDQLGETQDTLVGPYWNVYEGDFVNLTAPAAADLDEEDVNIIARENGEYCVTFDKDLVAGDYTLEIILDNGRKATFSWTVKDFGTAKELKIEYPRNTVELNGTTDVPDIYFLDENGVKKDASRYVDLGASGYAIKYFNTANGVVQVENDEKYIGDQIRVFAVAEREGLTAEAVLTVTSGEGSLVFDQNNGPVDFNNRVPFKVVDSEGNQLVLGTDKKIMSATVVVTKQSNPDAKISGNVATYSYNDILTKGAGILNLTSDKEGTAEVKVTLVVQNEENRDGITDAYDTQVYSGTLNYTFGDVDEYDGRIVVMVIGSADTIVDNKIVTIDAAPFVNADWRTMVPFRALAEDFGATVEWNEADQTVTAELDGVTLVMTIGSETYTVNGVEKTMDTAPVIVDGRTYVPVRFPAEAFGFDVVPTYNDEGLTSSVLFTK